jgi:hypothetical protein
MGWVGVVAVALVLAVGSSALVVTGLGKTRPARIAAAPGATAPGAPDSIPAAVFDDRLFDGSSIVLDEPFTIRVAAANPASRATNPVWLILEWRPADADPGQAADGTVIACDPTDCRSSDDPDTHRTVVRWAGLQPGMETTYEVTAQVTGIEPGDTFRYHATAGSGSRPDAIDAGSAWTLELAVEAPE